MAPRVPTEADFAPLEKTLPHVLHFPDPPESTTAILLIFHGLGDHEVPFANFAKNIALPGVLAITIRGVEPLPAALLGDLAEEDAPPSHFHWGDDLKLDTATGELDPDPGFEKAADLILSKLIKEILFEKCGWEANDILLFGFGQGGSFALGLSSRLQKSSQVTEVADEQDIASTDNKQTFKGVITVGGPLPMTMVSSLSTRQKSKTSVLACQLDDADASVIRQEFNDVQVVKWKHNRMTMPADPEEILPIMTFFAARLSHGYES